MLKLRRWRDEMADAKKEALKIKLIVALMLAVIFGWIIFKMVKMDATLSFDFSYRVPSGVDLSDIGGGISDVEWAATINGEVVAGNSEEIVQATASTAKMILALAVLDKKPIKLGEKGETLTITDEMYNKYVYYITHNGSNSVVFRGEKISEYDALVSVMLASSNNMADSLAIWAFGSIEEYRKYASEMLVRFGVNNTTISNVDASGYDASTTSTALDLAKIGYLVMKNEVLAEIVALRSYNVPVAGMIENTNKLLGRSLISGIKTGYIGSASGYCIVSGYVKDGDIVTVALLNADSRGASFEKNLAIVDEIQEKLVKQVLVSAGDEIGKYSCWWNEDVSVRASSALEKVIHSEQETNAKFENGKLVVTIDGEENYIDTEFENLVEKPTIWQRFLHVFGWKF